MAKYEESFFNKETNYFAHITFFHSLVVLMDFNGSRGSNPRPHLFISFFRRMEKDEKNEKRQGEV